MLKRVFTSILAILWLSVANHCFVASALAAPAKSMHACCHPQRSSAPVGPREHYPDKVCCQAFAPMTWAVPNLSAPGAAIVLPPVPALAYGPGISAPIFRPLPVQTPSHGPPLVAGGLVLSLTLAQNAPPC